MVRSTLKSCLEVQRSFAVSSGLNHSLLLLLLFPDQIYSPVAGAQEKITSLRYRHELISDSIANLDNRVARNTAELDQMRDSYGDDDYDNTGSLQPEAPEVTDDDIERELEEIRDLERRKRALDDRVTGMERDLGALME